MKKDFVSIRDYSRHELRTLLQEAIEIKSDPGKHAESLKGKALAMIFEKPSLRTRVTFDVGIHQLGGFSIYLSQAEINLGKRESVPDVARNLERMVQGIVARTFRHSVVEELAAHSRIPVINGLTDFNHPCQAMADFLTILEIKQDLQGVKLAYIGDGNNVATSLIHGAVRLGVRLSIATPSGYEPDSSVIIWARNNAAESGSQIEITNDPVQAVTGADVVYTDVWTSMGQESESEIRLGIFQPYQVNDDLLAYAQNDVIFMHCMPIHRGEEVSASVLDSSRSVVFQQAENRLHVQKSILLGLMR